MHDTFSSSNCSFGSRLCLSQIPSSGIVSMCALGQMVGICIRLLGCHEVLLPIGWLRQQKFTFSPVWRLEAQDQGACRDDFL